MCFSTALLVSTRVSAIAALLLPLAISARTSRSRAVSPASGERSTRTFAATSGSTILESSTEPPAATDSIAATSCTRSLDALLEQIGAALRAGLQQCHCVRGFGVVAQDDDADVGMLLAQEHRHADALVGARRRHPDVGHHHVGTLALDGLQE